MRKLIRKWLGIKEFEDYICDLIELNVGYQNKLQELIAKKTGIKLPKSKVRDLIEERSLNMGKQIDEMVKSLYFGGKD